MNYTDSFPQAQSSDFLQKLEKKFEAGNEDLTQFFQILGDKVRFALHDNEL